jgi:hypothetical protein
MKYLALFTAAIGVAAVTFPTAVFAGAKQVCNQSSITVVAKLTGRVGPDPSGGDLPAVAHAVMPLQCVTITYSTNPADPFLNDFSVAVLVGKSTVSEVLDIGKTDRGGVVDNSLNTNSIVDVNFSASNYSFTMSWHN